MDLEILKKKISTYRGEDGRVRDVSDELVMELLLSWEQWVGSTRDFAAAIGLNRNSIPKLIGKAKRLKREGHFPAEEFKEIKVEGGGAAMAVGPCTGIELLWEGGKVIRFPEVSQLVEFLKKAA